MDGIYQQQTISVGVDCGGGSLYIGISGLQTLDDFMVLRYLYGAYERFSLYW